MGIMVSEVYEALVEAGASEKQGQGSRRSNGLS